MRRLALSFAAYSVFLMLLSSITPPHIFLVFMTLFFVSAMVVVVKEYDDSLKELKAEARSRLTGYESEKNVLE